MSAPEPSIENTPPAVTVALPGNPTDPMSVSAHGEVRLEAATCPDTHKAFDHIARASTVESRNTSLGLHTFIYSSPQLRESDCEPGPITRSTDGPRRE